jgi:serine/threonine protein phosphatase PrpC
MTGLAFGHRRESNQDRAYASARLLAVADGMGGGGDLASAAAIEALKPLEASVPAGDLLNALGHAVRQASSALRDITAADPSLEGTGTTLTAMLVSGSQLALVHIGDTRAYVLRDGELFQITHDHTVVQSLLDEGRITPDEAASHPQRSLLLRALDGSGDAEPDLSLNDAPGRRPVPAVLRRPHGRGHHAGDFLADDLHLGPGVGQDGGPAVTTQGPSPKTAGRLVVTM